VTANQLRYFSKPLKRSGVIEKLIMESFDNGVAPTTVAVIAELAGGPATAAGENSSAQSSAALPFTWDKPTRVLLVGGGSSHDFDRFFNRADSKILQELEGVAVHYTDDPDIATRELPHVNVAVLSVNKDGFAKEPFRRRLLNHVDSGKGLILLHPGVWYNWRDWPEYNRILAGGGSRGHDAPLQFEVKLTQADHPLTKGLPSSFKITDELYWFDVDPKGTPIEVLATTHSPKKDKDYPMIWVVNHPKARIAGIALGHDARAHDLPEFRQLLKNAVTWAAANNPP
jgi:type 1 glutamine amidotransferase